MACSQLGVQSFTPASSSPDPRIVIIQRVNFDRATADAAAAGRTHDTLGRATDGDSLHRLLVPHDNAMATLAPPAAACCPPAASGEGKHVRLGKTLRCPDCPRTYHNKFSLLVHRRLQHEHPSPYSCNECGLSFPQARSSTTRRLPTNQSLLLAAAHSTVERPVDAHQDQSREHAHPVPALPAHLPLAQRNAHAPRLRPPNGPDQGAA